jgi:hypothetical protein
MLLEVLEEGVVPPEGREQHHRRYQHQHVPGSAFCHLAGGLATPKTRAAGRSAGQRKEQNDFRTGRLRGASERRKLTVPIGTALLPMSRSQYRRD